MRIALERVQRQPDLVQHPPDPLIPLLARADSLDHQRLVEDRVDPHPRVQRRVRVLEHHLQVAPGAPKLPAAGSEHLLAVEQDLPGVGHLDANDQLSKRRLAAPGFADQAEGLAGVEVQRDVGDGLDARDLALKEPRLDRVLANRIYDLEQVGRPITVRDVRDGSAGRRLTIVGVDLTGPSTGCQQENRWPESPVSGGSSSRQRSVA